MLLAGAALVVGSCARLEHGGPIAPPVPETVMPRVRVGLAVGTPSAAIGGGAALQVTQPDGTPVATIAAGVEATVSLAGTGIQVRIGGTALPVLEGATVAPEDAGWVRVNGRDYRGVVDLVRTAAGLVVANHLTLEDYLPGVVNAEMGRRAPEELEALHAQAVVSRTVALRAIGRFPQRGYDLLATVADQAYLGVAAEQPQGVAAVHTTRGMVLMHGGQVIDAFFHSTCGGRTAEPTEVFVGGTGRPYLQSVSDDSPAGTPYCAISPRYRWREEWAGDQLAATLRETLPAVGTPDLGRLRAVEVTARGATGRVMSIAVRHVRGSRPVSGANAVRQVLRPLAGGQLRSSHFSLVGTSAGDELLRLVAEGRGAGHGVGMCQWGAVGRARSGATWPEILAAYFPGTQLGRVY